MVFGVIFGELVLDLAPPLSGDIDLNVRAGMCPLCYGNPLPCIDRCYDVYSVVCINVLDSQTNKHKHIKTLFVKQNTICTMV